MTAIASAAPMIAPAPAPAAPANGSAGAGPNAAGGGAENGEFARQLERAHQNRDAAAEPARPEGTRKAGDSARSRRETDTAEADAPKTPAADTRAGLPAAADLGLGAEAGAAAEDDTTAEPPALDVSALLAGWAAPQPAAAAPRGPAGPQADSADAEAGASTPLAAAAGAPGTAAGGPDPIVTEALPPGHARADAARTDAASAETFTLPNALPAALPAGAAGAAGGAALAAPADAVPQRPAMTESTIATPLHSAGFAPALGAEVSLLVKGGVQEARLHLNPAEMGPITVRIEIEGDRAQVTMSAEQAPTRQALEQALPSLAGALRENGLTLTGGGVFEQSRQARDGQSGQPGQPGRAQGRADGSADDDGALAAAGRAAPARARGMVDVYA